MSVIKKMNKTNGLCPPGAFYSKGGGARDNVKIGRAVITEDCDKYEKRIKQNS